MRKNQGMLDRMDVVWDENHEKILHLRFEGRMADETPQAVGAAPATGSSSESGPK